MSRPELAGGEIEIGQIVHVDPERRHRHHQIGEPEPHRRDFRQPLAPARDLLAHQVLSCHAEMQPPRRQLARDLGGREQHHLNPVDAFTVPRYSRPAPALASVTPRLANQPMVSSCNRPFDGTPSFSRIAPPAPRAGRCRRPRVCPALPQHPGQRVVAPAAGDRRQIGPATGSAPNTKPS